MSLLTPAVLVVFAVAALCAFLGRRIRSRAVAIVALIVASTLCVGGMWLGASDGWAFRDGFPLPCVDYQTTSGFAAARAFLANSWVPLLAALATAAWIAAGWRRVTQRVMEAGQRSSFTSRTS